MTLTEGPDTVPEQSVRKQRVRSVRSGLARHSKFQPTASFSEAGFAHDIDEVQ